MEASGGIGRGGWRRTLSGSQWRDWQSGGQWRDWQRGVAEMERQASEEGVAVVQS
ncbi:unnamed protein product [Staurois parvus]|uniref:Uncharacterized protein n=1 Tax=Staurois parvus TaxID=386267 RepID=A0ABN9E665_9NEOB|nr:unnamed protein product [Staurois parvus]